MYLINSYSLGVTIWHCWSKHECGIDGIHILNMHVNFVCIMNLLGEAITQFRSWLLSHRKFKWHV